MNLSDLKEKLDNKIISTPCYVADMTVLDRHIDVMLDITQGAVELCYAMKANPFLTEHLDKRIGRIEVCSPGELEICMAKKIPGRDIIFSGVNKTKDNIEKAIEYGVDVVTLESVKHFNLVRDYCASTGKTVKVLIRLSSGAQFGMTHEELTNIIANRDNYPYIDIEGIHYFTGTQKKQIAKDIEEIEYIDALIKSLKEEYGFVCRKFEYGPGLAVPYFEGEAFESRYDGLKELTEYIKKLRPEYVVTFELGRFFVAESMQYLTRIDDIKKSSDANICIVDGGIHHVNYYGQNMAMRVPRIDVLRFSEDENALEKSDNHEADWRVCGSLCTFADVLVRKANLGQLEFGDVLVFNDAGAYSVTEAPIMFLSRRMPNIYVCNEQNEIIVLRENKESFTINM